MSKLDNSTTSQFSQHSPMKNRVDEPLIENNRFEAFVNDEKNEEFETALA